MRFKVLTLIKLKFAVGDVMLDKYIYGETSGFPKPLLSLNINNEETDSAGLKAA